MGKTAKSILTAFVFVFSFPAISQDIPVTIKDTAFNKEISIAEVTISATRFPENQKFVAQQVVGISSKKMEQYNQPTTAEMLGQSGQVLIQKSQLGGGSPNIRGFEANRVLIVIDGIRMNNAIYRGGHLQNVITLDNQALEKAEILLGPSSVIYGSDALGGVMSFYTKKPAILDSAEKTKIHGASSLRYASAMNEMTGHLDFSVNSSRIASFSSITVSSFDDLRQGKKKFKDYPDWGLRNFYQGFINGRDTMLPNPNPDKLTPSGYEQIDALQKFLFRTGRITHTLNLQFSSSSDVPRFDRLTETDSAGTFRNAEWYYGPQKRFLSGWTLNLPASSWFEQSQIIFAYQDITESRHNRSFGSKSLKHRTERVKMLSGNADFSKKQGSTEWYYGSEITFNKVNSSAFAENILDGTLSNLDTRYPDGGSRTFSLSLYGSMIEKLSDKWVLNAGLRVFHNFLDAKFIDTAFFPFPFREINQKSISATGNAGLIFFPGRDWKLSLLFSSGYRTPNVDDLSKVFESTAGNIIVPNPNLKPERTFNHEFSVSKRIRSIFQGGASAWFTDYRNILTTDSSDFNGQQVIVYDGIPSYVFTTVNKKKAYLWGTSANISLAFARYFSFQGNVQYTVGRIRDKEGDTPLDHIPPLFGKLSLSATVKKLSAECFMLFQGVKRSQDYNLNGEDNQIFSADPQLGFTPAWQTLNLRIGLDINRLIRVQGAVENMLDRYYRIFSSGIGAPGRNFILTLRARF